jgi:hypothetical protein
MSKFTDELMRSYAKTEETARGDDQHFRMLLPPHG